MKITNLKCIITAPAGIALVVVKVETDQAGLYGVGCATYTQRARLVQVCVEEYLKPLLIGRDPSRSEDLWQLCMVNPYWRNGPVENNAIAGVDMALWDIKGKVANLPVYELLGGKCREGAAVYRHADGREPQEVLDNVLRYQEQGYHYIRCQMGGYGMRTRDFMGPTDGNTQATHHMKSLDTPPNSQPGAYYDPDLYARAMPQLFDYIRSKIGFELELLHDVHERLAPSEVIRLAKNLEPYRLFFLEDPLAPEQIEWFTRLREQSAIPIAMGELYNNPVEWKSLIVNQLIDFIRVHITQIGGLTPARKLAALCEAFSIRTAWHGPGDVSPIGHMANVHLDVACHNFGIQEVIGFADVLREVFPGCPEIRNGYIYPNDKPGWGMDINETLAAKYPYENTVIGWTQARLPDGTIARP
jgi:mannonate dehydratase